MNNLRVSIFATYICILLGSVPKSSHIFHFRFVRVTSMHKTFACFISLQKGILKFWDALQRTFLLYNNLFVTIMEARDRLQY